MSGERLMTSKMGNYFYKKRKQKPFVLITERQQSHTHSCYRTSEEILVHLFIRVSAIAGLNQLRSKGRDLEFSNLSSKGFTRFLKARN